MKSEDSPFTPGQPVPSEFFVGRANEICELQARARRAFKRRRPEFLLVSGELGIGKSSLASIAKNLIEQKLKAITAHVHLNRIETLPEMLKQSFDRLVNDNLGEPWFPKLQKWFGGRIIKIGLVGLTVEFSSGEDKLASLEHNFALKTQGMLQKLKEERKGMLLIWDDINVLAESRDFGLWIKSTADEVFTNKMDLPLCIVLVGTKEQRHQLISSHESLNHMFTIIDIKPWSDEETTSFYRDSFIDNKKSRLSELLLKTMVKYTGGLPLLAQEIGDAVWCGAEEQELVLTPTNVFDGIFRAAEKIRRKILPPGVTEELRSEKYGAYIRSYTNALLLSENSG